MRRDRKAVVIMEGKEGCVPCELKKVLTDEQTLPQYTYLFRCDIEKKNELEGGGSPRIAEGLYDSLSSSTNKERMSRARDIVSRKRGKKMIGVLVVIFSTVGGGGESVRIGFMQMPAVFLRGRKVPRMIAGG